MTTRNLVLSAMVCAIATVSPGARGAAAQGRPPVGPEKPFQLAPRVERTLPNGLRVVIVRQTVVPKATITLTILSGLSSDPADLPGVASLTADLVQEGTKTRTSKEIRSQVFGMGGSLTASVSQDFSTLTTRVLSEFTPAAIELLADVVMNPALPADELAIIKQQHLQGVMQNKASPQFVANREFRQALFGDHPYARVGETEGSLQAIDRGRIEAFQRSSYRPNNAIVIVVGAVDPPATISAIEKAFGGWTRAEAPKPTFAKAPTATTRRVYFVQRPNSVQSSIALGNLSVKRNDPRWYELTLANTIFGGAFNSRIIRNIREDKGYTYSPGSALAGFADAGFYRFTADVRNEVTGPTLTEVFKEIDKFRADGPEAAELQGAKQYGRGLFPLQTATQTGLANMLNTVYVFGLPKDYPETYRAKIAAVTADQVKSAAASLLGSENSTIVIVGDYTKVKQQLADYKGITFLDLDGKTTSEPR